MNPLYHPVTPDGSPLAPPSSPAPLDLFMEVESLNSASQTSSSNQEHKGCSLSDGIKIPIPPLP